MECQHCKKVLSTKYALVTHQNSALYCLKIQGKESKKNFECDICGKEFRVKFHIQNHQKICEKNIPKKFIDNINELKSQNNKLTTENNMLKSELKNIREDYKELSITAVKKPTTSTKNIQINNYIKNMPPLLDSDIKDNVQYLTLDHHSKGAEGYAEYALEFPFKNKIVCVDVTRNKIKYKNEDGDIIEDIGFKKMMTKLCEALKDRSFNLSQAHYEKLSDNFTDKEMEEYNFMETAIAISKFANGRENDFCNQIIKMISKNTANNPNVLQIK